MEKYTQVTIDGRDFIDAKEIEYKKVDPEVFIRNNYTVNKLELEYDQKRYLTDSIYNIIDLDTSSTDILNVATGTGKTTAIYKLTKKILDYDDSSIIIMATPFIALVNKDFESLTKKYGINEETITDYRNLKKEFESLDTKIWSTASIIDKQYIEGRRIHIITINALLRNPGDVAFEQQAVKTDYLNNLIDYCKANQKKVYLIIDEIHASIHNFKNEFIHYLTMWENVIYKVIVSTATFTEPVYTVVKHLAYSTNDVINIYESKRIKQIEVSPLDIIFYPNKYDKKDLSLLGGFIKDWVNRFKSDTTNFHILSYSRKLAEELEKLDLLENKNLVTGLSKLPFDENLNNIGTSFSTGINIDREGDLFIILLPCKYSDDLVKGDEGIFYDGLPSILQAVARLRKKGRILFVIPPMQKVINTTNTKALFDILNSIEYYPLKSGDFVKEDFLIDEKGKLEKILAKSKEKVKKEIKSYENNIKSEHRKHVQRPEIQFPNDSTFILERGQEYLKYTNYKSGKYITPYIYMINL